MYQVFLPNIQNQSPKRFGLGFAYQDFSDLELLNASWYYVWGFSKSYKDKSNKEYIPMLRKFDTSIGEEYTGDILLFNEPNVMIQDNLSPEQASKIYIEVKSFYTKARFIVGNVSIFATNWLRDFVKLHPEVDRVGVHCYCEYGFTNSYIGRMLDSLEKDLQIPIWVTEFNNLDPSVDRFRELCEVISDRDFIERLAPFTNRQSGKEWWNLKFSDLVSKEGFLTEKGKVYASISRSSTGV